MLRRLKENKKKGFTLVELIVVLVILAILAALLVPALTGYIDKAKRKSIVAETRQVVMAAQTVVDEKYGTVTEGTAVTLTVDQKKEIRALAEVKGTLGEITCTETANANKNIAIGTINKVVYTSADGKYTCTYSMPAAENASDGNYDVETTAASSSDNSDD